MKNNAKMLELLLSGKIDDLEKALKENIQEENNKKAGTKKEATIIKKFLKHVKNRKDLNGAFKIDGSFYFCNMYSVLKSCNDYGFEHVEGFKNAKNMFSQKFDKYQKTKAQNYMINFDSSYNYWQDKKYS